jgi:prephenate dehydrogenase
MKMVASDKTAMLERVTVMGCGLSGGSIVKALRRRGEAIAIFAIDDEQVLSTARLWLDDCAPCASPRATELVASSDLTVLAMPVGSIVANLPWVLESLGTRGIATDTGSVKRAIVAAARSRPQAHKFVGGHPMAGRELGGFAASTPTLFEGSRWFLIEDAPGSDAVLRVASLARAVGATPVSVDADVHDRAMAYVSHAPQLIASALLAVAGRAGVLDDAGPGFRDLVRIAGGPTNVWRDILDANRLEIAAALARILEPLVAIQGKLASEGEPDLALAISLLDEAKRRMGSMSGGSVTEEKENG